MQRGPDRCPECIRRVHGSAHPGHDLPGSLRTGDGHAPSKRTGYEETLTATQHRTAQQQDRDRKRRSLDDRGRAQVQQSRTARGQQADHHCVFGAPGIGMVACLHPRGERSDELAPRDQQAGDPHDPFLHVLSQSSSVANFKARRTV